MARPCWPATARGCSRGMRVTEQTLQLTLDLPHRWERLSLPAQAVDGLWQHDLRVLRVLNETETHAHREAEAQPGRERLEAKLDLALHLLAQALYGGQTPPPPRAISLSAAGAELASTEALHMGEHLVITLYLSSTLALPVRMPAEVVEAGPQRFTVRWSGMPEACLDAWEQWLFRQHRRHVHEQRSQRTS